MVFIPIKVECYSGYKVDEHPRRFFWRNQVYEVNMIIDRWYQGDANLEWPVADYFKVRVTGGGEFIIRHETESDRWYLLKPMQSEVFFGAN